MLSRTPFPKGLVQGFCKKKYIEIFKRVSPYFVFSEQNKPEKIVFDILDRKEFF